MRVQAMLHGGPYNGHLMTINHIGTEAPEELRLASLLDEFEGEKVDASLYRLIDDETHEAVRTTFASFEYLHPVKSRLGLVDVWMAVKGTDSEL